MLLTRHLIRARGSHAARSIAKRAFRLAPDVPSRAPSATTTIELSNLPYDVTQSSLSDTLGSLKDLGMRSVNVEPGCIVHVPNEASASYVMKKLMTAPFNIPNEQCHISRTTYPAVLLENLPADISIGSITSGFAANPPKFVHINGTPSVVVSVASTGDSTAAADEALTISKLISSNSSQDCRISRLSSDGGYLVYVNGFPVGQSDEENLKSISTLLSQDFPNANIAISNSNKSSIILKFSSKKSMRVDHSSLREAVSQRLHTSLGEESIESITEPIFLKKPAVVINSKTLDMRIDECVEKVKSEYNPTRVQVQHNSRRLKSPDQIIVYFDSESNAYSALQSIRKGGLNKGNRQVAASYRKLSEPVIRISNLPSDTTEAELKEFLSFYKPDDVILSPAHDSSGKRNGFAILNSPTDVKLASDSLSRHPFRPDADEQKAPARMNYHSKFRKNEHIVSVTPAWEYGCDLGFELFLNDKSTVTDKASMDAIVTALGGLNQEGSEVSPQASSIRSNVSAFLAYENMTQVTAAKDGYVKGKLNIGSAGVDKDDVPTARVSVVPSSTLQCVGLDANMPMSTLHEAFMEDNMFSPLGYDRKAILKFRKHKEIVPALKALKKLSLGGAQQGSKVKVERYRPLDRFGDSEYDEYGNEEKFEEWSLKEIMKDYLGADPGLRMAIARNAFDRALVDAKAYKDIQFLLTENAPEDIKREASQLMQGASTKVKKNRLFELFLQREDMVQFVADFHEMTAFLGDADENDPFDWSQFKIDGDEDLERLREAMVKKDLEASLYYVDEEGELKESSMKTLAGKGMNKSANTDDVVIKEGNTEVDEPNLEDPLNMIDSEGRQWSGKLLSSFLLI